MARTFATGVGAIGAAADEGLIGAEEEGWAPTVTEGDFIVEGVEGGANEGVDLTALVLLFLFFRGLDWALGDREGGAARIDVDPLSAPSSPDLTSPRATFSSSPCSPGVAMSICASPSDEAFSSTFFFLCCLPLLLLFLLLFGSVDLDLLTDLAAVGFDAFDAFDARAFASPS